MRDFHIRIVKRHLKKMWAPVSCSLLQSLRRPQFGQPHCYKWLAVQILSCIANHAKNITSGGAHAFQTIQSKGEGLKPRIEPCVRWPPCISHHSRASRRWYLRFAHEGGHHLFFCEYAKIAYLFIDRKRRMSTTRGTTHDMNTKRHEHGARSIERQGAQPEQSKEHHYTHQA